MFTCRNNALYKAESTTTTAPPPPKIQIVYVERDPPKKLRRTTTASPAYYYDDYGDEALPSKSTTASPDEYYDYYDSEVPAKPSTTTTTRRPIRTRTPRPSPSQRRPINKRPTQANFGRPAPAQDEGLERIVQQKRKPIRRVRPNQRGKLQRKRRKKTTTTTTTTTAAPEYEYYDDDYYYYYDDSTSSTTSTTTQAPQHSPSRLSLEERRRNRLKSRKAKLQRVAQKTRKVSATNEPEVLAEERASVVQEAPLDEEAEYVYDDLPPENDQPRGSRQGQREVQKQETFKRRNQRVRSRTPSQ